MFGHIIDSVRTVDCFLYGRRMYEGMAEYWPTADTDPESDDQHVEFSRKWKDTPKIVFSRSLDHADWNTRVVSADIGAEITRLKRQPGGGLVLFGGADIASSLMKLDLIDEFHLFVHPVVLGGGTALFGVDERVDLQLVEARTFEPGAAAEWAGAGSSSSSTVVELHYKRPTPPRAALLTSLLT
ncbi:MAG: dihydrofolate reductase family protein [Thermoleophilaceae bacterium]